MNGTRTKLFRNGGSQAVRLPKECRFRENAEVIVRRQGKRVIIEPADEWSKEFLACLGAWDGKMIPRPRQKPIRETRNPFE